MFRIGQKVVCIIGGRMQGGHGTEITPVEGAVYTIRDIIDPGDGVGVRLVEIKNPQMRYARQTMECTFSAKIFRPIVEKKTDTGMAILREILERETINDRATAMGFPSQWSAGVYTMSVTPSARTSRKQSGGQS